MATINAINSNIPIEVTKGGTGAATLTQHGVLLGGGASAVTALGVGATGTVLAGVTGSDPAFTGSPSFSGTITATTFRTSPTTAYTSLTGTTVTMSGSDANVDFNVTTKGTGGMIYRGISVGWLSTEWHTRQNSVQTTNATPTIIASIALADSEMVSIVGVINGFQDDYTDCVGGQILVTAYRPAGGNVTLVGAPIINVNYTDLVDTSDIDANVDVATQSVRLLVVGVAAQNWNWVTTYSYMFTISNV